MLINPFAFQNTVLLLHCNGTDGSTTFTDSSENPYTVTAVGNAQVDTAQSVFGGGSLLLDGTGAHLSVPDINDWDMWLYDSTTGFHLNSTIDFHCRFAAFPAINTVYDIVAQGLTAGGAGTYWRLYLDNQVEALRLYFTVRISSGLKAKMGVVLPAASFLVDTWYHIAVEKHGADVNFYVDGVKQTTVIEQDWLTITNIAATLTIGADADGDEAVNGWLDEIRISKGIARYGGSNFTPETAEYE